MIKGELTAKLAWACVTAPQPHAWSQQEHLQSRVDGSWRNFGPLVFAEVL